MKECKAANGIAASLDNAMRGNSLTKSGWLAPMSHPCLRSDLRGVRCSSDGSERAASAPHQLQSRKDRDHGDHGLQLVGGNFACEQASRDKPITANTNPKSKSVPTTWAGVISE